ncbi:MAG: CDP-diacylglycerol--serine O-phosphatidyltransferase [Bdellovibrionaceae bacterium]|nr:CDP-diacylglycerol--serine O-phosphatidyltransferase [Pseudobdellovibrionaceae bacterium]
MTKRKKTLKSLGKRTKKFRERFSVNIYVLPNLLTTANMFCGFFAIVYSIKGQFLIGSYAIVAAAIFDLLDGRVARMTNSTSQFGAEYDSLSDIVSFGMAPGILLFLWSLQPFGRLGWLAAFFYLACGGLRLARFNVQKKVINVAYFQGLPIPMAAGIVASCVLAFDDLGLDPWKSWNILAMTFLLGFTMVSNFNYRSFKDIDLKERLPFTYLVMGVFLFAIVALHPEVMLFVLFLTYAVLGAVFGVLKLGKTQRKVLAEGEPHDGDLDQDIEFLESEDWDDETPTNSH